VSCLQVQFVLDDNFKLDDLLKLELHKFADEVGEIVDCAQKEEKMEQGLAKLKVVCWLFLWEPTCMADSHIHIIMSLNQTSEHACIACHRLQHSVLSLHLQPLALPFEHCCCISV